MSIRKAFKFIAVVERSLIALAALTCSSCETVYVSAYPDAARPIGLVMEDLRHGQGVNPPPVRKELRLNPILFDVPGFIDGHGWLSEGNDLMREALSELQRREKSGKLPAANRRETDQLALAYLHKPLKTPGQYYLRQDLGDRWMAGALPADELAQFYKTAVSVTLSTDPVASESNGIPLKLNCKCNLPACSKGRWKVHGRYDSLRVDGERVELKSDPLGNMARGSYAFEFMQDVGGGGPGPALIPSQIPGKHRLDVQFTLDISAFEAGPVVHSESLSFSIEFAERPPSLLQQCLRFLEDPQAELLHYVSVQQLHEIIENPQAAWNRPAMLEFMRRRRLAELDPREEQLLIADLLAAQKHVWPRWAPEYGNFIEWLHDQHKLSDEQWKQYGAHQLIFFIHAQLGGTVIQQGDPLPIEICRVARHGNSTVQSFSGAAWKMQATASEGVTGPILLDDVQMPLPPISVAVQPAETEARFTSTKLGKHKIHIRITDYDLTWTDRRADLPMPTEYDCGDVEFTVVPKKLP